MVSRIPLLCFFLQDKGELSDSYGNLQDSATLPRGLPTVPHRVSGLSPLVAQFAFTPQQVSVLLPKRARSLALSPSPTSRGSVLPLACTGLAGVAGAWSVLKSPSYLLLLFDQSQRCFEFC